MTLEELRRAVNGRYPYKTYVVTKDEYETIYRALIDDLKAGGLGPLQGSRGGLMFKGVEVLVRP